MCLAPTSPIARSRRSDLICWHTGSLCVVDVAKNSDVAEPLRIARLI